MRVRKLSIRTHFYSVPPFKIMILQCYPHSTLKIRTNTRPSPKPPQPPFPKTCFSTSSPQPPPAPLPLSSTQPTRYPKAVFESRIETWSSRFSIFIFFSFTKSEIQTKQLIGISIYSKAFLPKNPSAFEILVSNNRLLPGFFKSQFYYRNRERS